MCGIVGIFDNRNLIDQTELDQLTDSLTHRGPDGRGTWINHYIGLGHRRLAILDITDAGRNPMAYTHPSGKKYWITYNGEIYNFLELRQELTALGHRFKTQTDTEVVVAAYSEWGDQSLLRFNGMWAFAVYDTSEKNIFLARDRFGVKPLYYLNTGSRFIFASEIKAFLAVKGFTPEFNNDLFPLIIQNSYAYEGSTDKTLMRGLRRLPAGHCINLNSVGRHQVKQWWDTREHILSVPQKYSQQVDEFRDLFLDAVRIRMRSDVPVGTCLSGGVDSSAVASAMTWHHQQGKNELKRCSEDWQQAFIAVFPGTALDEKEYADEVVGHLDAQPRYWVFNDREALGHILDSVWSMEEVYGAIAVPIWCTYRLLKQFKVTVSLDGHGADELLGGYTWYLDWTMDKFNSNLYRDFHQTLLPSILRNYDRCSMAHGVEVRMPLMDWRVVAYSFGLPAQSKIGGGFTKRILRDAMIGIMPDKNRNRRSKIGFNSPMIEWYNNGLSRFLIKATDHPIFSNNTSPQSLRLREVVLQKTRTRTWNNSDWGLSLQVWTFLNMILWHLMFIEKEDKSSILNRYF